METKKTFGFIVAIFAVLFAASFVLAGVTSGISIDEVSLNDVSSLHDSVLSLSASPGETIPVVIKFTATENLQDLKLKVWIDGYRSDVYASTSLFDVRTNSDTNESNTYVKRLSLTLPNADDMESSVDESLTLHVRIADKNEETAPEEYTIDLQREANSINVLSVEMPSKASAGEIIALDIVLENAGANKIDNAFVTVTIPELGAYRKVFFGDLYTQDDSGDNQDDTRERRIYLTVPSDSKSGDYELQVKASDYDTTSTVKKVITITGLAADSTDSSAIDAGKTDKIPTSIVVLTVVLVVVFVVLLVVLIVLLTKKPTDKVEDFGESYY